MNLPHSVKDRYWLHITLFLLTLGTTTWSGAEMAGRFLLYEAASPWFSMGSIVVSAPFIIDGLLFSCSLLLFLTVHEFGHYFAARRHRVSTSLPFFIPFPFNGIGTFGAVIRIRQQIPSMRKLFDIGVAGPLAGFVIALLVLLVGFWTLPGPDYIEGMPGHDNLKEYIVDNGSFPPEIIPESTEEGNITLFIGVTPLYWILSQFFSDVPPMWEMYHYPILFAGWLGLFFTALNLLPVGQLDGGHILYALIGPKWHSIVARGFVMILLFSGGLGFISEMKPVFYAWDPLLGDLSWLILASMLYFYLHKIFEGKLEWMVPSLLLLVAGIAASSTSSWMIKHIGYSGWLVWSLLIILLIKVDHPPVAYMEQLTPKRRILAFVSLLIFALCFSIKPLYIG
ncbi:site-2 protease family protein [bacterium]|nr:site-2 protease family protein [bacterium]